MNGVDKFLRLFLARGFAAGGVGVGLGSHGAASGQQGSQCRRAQKVRKLHVSTPLF